MSKTIYNIKCDKYNINFELNVIKIVIKGEPIRFSISRKNCYAVIIRKLK